MYFFYLHKNEDKEHHCDKYVYLREHMAVGLILCIERRCIFAAHI